MTTLSQLHTTIETRVQAIRSEHTDWLCCLGCDHCCHQLAAIPRLTLAEWEWLKQGLETLAPEQLDEISDRLNQLAAHPTRPVVCPLLDQTRGACRVYNHRPIACRTYGFYRQRDKGLYCPAIETSVAAGHWSEVIWGNQEVIDRQLSQLGTVRELTDWFAQWRTNQQQ